MSYRRLLTTVLVAFLLAMSGLAVQAFSVQAAPVAPIDHYVTQPDGTTFVAVAWGDEWQHGFETKEGYSIVKDPATGYWVYATRLANGSLAPTLKDGKAPLVVGRDSPAGLPQHVRPARSTTAAKAQERTQERTQMHGSQPMLVLLVEFANRTHTYTAADFQKSFFGASSSVAAFYNTASFGQLTIAPVTETNGTANDGMIGWVKLNYNHPDPSDGVTGAAQVIRDALTAVDSSINFAALDTNGDGYISANELHIIVVAAGYEQSWCGGPCGAGMPSFWGHRGDLDGYDPYLDGKHIGQSAYGGGYAIFGEIQGMNSTSDPNHQATMGVMTHELGHDLSWPDLYDVDYNSQGVGDWSIMGGGSWNGVTQPGDSPAMADAWLKWYQGWLTPTTVASGGTATLRTAEAYPDALLVGTNPNGVDWNFTKNSGTGEYWLVENREWNSGFDSGLPGCGLLVWHIDETVTSSNYANTWNPNPLVALEQADGMDHLRSASAGRGDANDPFPGGLGKYNFNSYTTPNSKNYDGTLSSNSLHITSTSCGSSMTVSYSVEEPVVKDKFLYEPFLQNPTVPYTGKLTDNGKAVAGYPVTLWYYDGTEWNEAQKTATAADGSFKFSAPPALTSDTRYQVEYANDDKHDSWLSYFDCNIVTSTSTDMSCNINVHDIVYKTPGAGTAVNLPTAFSWTKRTVTSDNYEWDLWEVYNNQLTNDGYIDGLGYTSSFTLTGIPSSFYTYYWYYWNMYTSNAEGYGMARYFWGVQFKDYNAPSLVQIPADQLIGKIQTGPRMYDARRMPLNSGWKWHVQGAVIK